MVERIKTALGDDVKDVRFDNYDGDGFYSRKARPGYGNSINELPESEQLPADYGFPTCKEWWLGEGVINTPYVAEEALSTDRKSVV